MTDDDIKNMVELLRRANSSGVVCDAVFACEGWQKSYEQIEDGLNFFEYQTDYNKYRGDRFKYCAWCSKEIDWSWERLKI